MLLHNEDEAREYTASLCSADAFALLGEFEKCLRAEAAQQNIIARSTLDAVWLRHIADSAQLLTHVPRETGTWLDIGTGGGFPGLVVAIMRPDLEMVLVEPRRLRADWLKTIVEQFELRNCLVECKNIEVVTAFSATIISARAFTNLPRLISLSARFSTNATIWVLPKGQSAAQDIELLSPALKSRFHVKQSVTDPLAKIVVGNGHMGKGA